MSMTDADLKSLTYRTDPDKPESSTPVVLGYQNRLRAFIAYVLHSQDTSGFRMDSIDIIHITSTEYDQWQVKGYNPERPLQTSSAPTSTQPLTTSQKSAANEFRKGIKRDKTQYKELKTDKEWDAWK